MNLLLATIESGIPKYRHEMAQSIREYHQFRDELYSVDGVVIYKDRVVIPPSLRNEVLLALHAAHQGVTSMTSRAEASVFWPGITLAIATTRARCEHCNRIAPSQPNAPPFQPVSPAMCLFGRLIKDFIPILPGRYKPHDTWRQTLAAREEALRNRHMKSHERWSEHTKQLPPLRVGDFVVRIQNQIEHHPKKWDKTGTVIEVRQFNQYVVRVDGSGRVTLRNRKFLRKYAPVVPRQPHHTINNDLNYMQQPTKIVSLSSRTIDDIPDSHTANMIPHTPIVHKQTRPSDLTLSQTSPSGLSTPPQQVRKHLPTMSTLTHIPSPQLSPPPDHSRPSEPATPSPDHPWPSQTVPPPPQISSQ